jgi:hypothetical protein
MTAVQTCLCYTSEITKPFDDPNDIRFLFSVINFSADKHKFQTKHMIRT